MCSEPPKSHSKLISRTMNTTQTLMWAHTLLKYILLEGSSPPATAKFSYSENHMLCETSQQKGNSHVLGRVIPVVLGIYSLDMCIKVHKDKFNLGPMHCRRGKKQTTHIHKSRCPESDKKRSNHPPRKKIVNYVPARAWNTMQPLRLSPYQQRKMSMIHYSLKKQTASQVW